MLSIVKGGGVQYSMFSIQQVSEGLLVQSMPIHYYAQAYDGTQ